MIKNRLIILVILAAGCSQLEQISPINLKNKSKENIGSHRYTVMPDQDCPKENVGRTLVDSQVVHPNEKLCFYG